MSNAVLWQHGLQVVVCVLGVVQRAKSGLSRSTHLSFHIYRRKFFICFSSKQASSSCFSSSSSETLCKFCRQQFLNHCYSRAQHRWRKNTIYGLTVTFYYMHYLSVTCTLRHSCCTCSIWTYDVHVKEALFVKFGRSKSEIFAGGTQKIEIFRNFFKEIDSTLP